ncbi:transporter [Rhizobium sp. 1AS11]|uniref:SphA family protein n=1 Tax=Rhizobium acaciae TaxID=2989736 RepID=UPI00221FEAFD|nr:transporter [Rhizobium acaciae]MCW1409738.1 transporter [Rhizobium acaciae]MCW1742009.1 transporter [Rhizobium acaciae]MCW1751053.1 transporter [Rhizobium acaciae]
MRKLLVFSVAFTFLAGAAATLLPSLAFAAEGGAGFYLLGSKGPAAAITPPPGVFFSNDIYFYTGDLGGGKALPTGGRLAVGVEGKAVIAVPTVLWILPEDVAGGHLGLSMTVPVGWKNTDADVTLAGPRGGTASGSISDSVFTVGDPVLGALLGWEAGNFHWQTSLLVNVPIGDYQDGEISNIAFHHWGADISAGVTWLDPTIGLDLSAVVGMTFNAENPATDYRTGNEFHLEWAAVQHFNEQFDAGLVGYYYDQVSGDSGAGASSDFKGRVAAIGATIGWTFKAGEVPISTRIKYFHEFEAENRAEGDAVYLTVSMPLSITKPMNIAAQ